MNLDEWRNRKLQVRVLVHCDECEQLKEDVRSHDWPSPRFVCCSPCFSRLVADHEELAAVAAYQRGWNDRQVGRPFSPPPTPQSANYTAGYYDAGSK